jgi:UDPglucose 6-dehydrogenase
MSSLTVGYAGMTHLGIVSGTVTALKGLKTICFDDNVELIADIKNGKLPIAEPQLQETIALNSSSQVFTSDPSDLKSCDIIFVSPDVSTDDQGNSSLDNVNSLANIAISHIKKDAILVILCQVPPGFTRQISFKKAQLYYQVETLIFGNAIERATSPERIIIGCDEPTVDLPKSYNSFLECFKCPILKIKYESAELSKIAINLCLTSSITVTNVLSEICEKIGADWGEIMPALQLDKRIGKFSYLSPGLGLSGGNLERDLVTVIKLAKEHQTNVDVIKSFIDDSDYRKQWASKIVHSLTSNTSPKLSICIWGLAYKKNTHSIKNSASIATISALKECSFRVYDPAVKSLDQEFQNLVFSETAFEALDNADILMVLTPWDEFASFDIKEIHERMNSGVIIDPYKMLNHNTDSSPDIDYYTIGVCKYKKE